MDKYVKVALNISHNDGVFTYGVPESLAQEDLFGRRVKVSIKNKQYSGVVIDQESTKPSGDYKIKDLISIIDERAIITKEQLELMIFCARYYFNSLGPTIHLALPRNEKKVRKNFVVKNLEPNANELTAAQSAAYQEIAKSEARAFLLQGVTGSGKTHVYLKAARDAVLANKSVLFLVPEISLTPDLVKRVEKGLGLKTVSLHSNISPAQKRDALFALLDGEAKVLVGARSAIFAPLPNLGLIVVDEEHDQSLKQDESPRYHARDLALWRAKSAGAKIILGSATPSLESIFNARTGKLTHLVLTERFTASNAMPKVTVIDLKDRSADIDLKTKDQSLSAGQKMCILSRPLVNEIKNTLARQEQVLLFLNQRGYARFGVCNKCGHMVECPNCSIGLTYYQKRNGLLCHQCQHSEAASTVCRHCRQDAVAFLGLGTERLEEEVRMLFKDAKVYRLDRDVVRSQKRLNDTLEAMHEREADILIGTQMITKGHNFLHVGLVGVVCADVALSMPDFRASEKTFQILTQVAGRAGRGSSEGRAFIQTFNPQHPAIHFAKDHDVDNFIEQELSMRRRFSQPPYSRAALLRSEHMDADTAKNIIDLAFSLIKDHQGISVLGPAPSFIERVNNRYRFQCFLMGQKSLVLHQAIANIVSNKVFKELVTKKRARFIIDIDPQN